MRPAILPTASTSAASPSNAEDLFIHFDNSDQRLDDWVPAAAVTLLSPLVEFETGLDAKNRKRKRSVTVSLASTHLAVRTVLMCFSIDSPTLKVMLRLRLVESTLYISAGMKFV